MGLRAYSQGNVAYLGDFNMKKFIFAVALLMVSIGCNFSLREWKMQQAQKAFSELEIFQLTEENTFLIRNNKGEVYLVERNSGNSGDKQSDYQKVKIFTSQFNPNAFEQPAK
jgi:hypothetical protein